MTQFNYSIKDELSLSKPGSSMNLMVSALGKKAHFGDSFGVSFPITIRLNPGNHAILEAMAKRSGQAKNSICNEILSIGFGYVLDHLDDDSQHEIDLLASQVFSEIIPAEVLAELSTDSQPVKQKSKTSSKK